jgi:excisionase family DNA binding protein
MAEQTLITVGEARDILGVSNHTVARLVKEGHLRAIDNPLDKRQKLVALAEVEALVQRRPRRLDVGQHEKKLAA